MTVQDVMTRRVATCRLETNLAEATARMWENDCGSLPVISDEGRLAGMVTDRDICIAMGTRNVRSSQICVKDLVRNHVLTCGPSDDIHMALTTMREGKVRRLPVVNEQGAVVGIISMDDLVLNAERDGRMGSAISYADVVNTLQGIYARELVVDEPAAA